jgi:hypothetical protein
MLGILWILAALGAIAAWIVSGIMASQRGGLAGRKFYFLHLGLSILSVVILFLVVVVPSFNCSGFLCGLYEIFVFIGLGTIVLLVWPLILIPIIKSKFKGNSPTSSALKDDLIDDLENEIQ